MTKQFLFLFNFFNFPLSHFLQLIKIIVKRVFILNKQNLSLEYNMFEYFSKKVWKKNKMDYRVLECKKC